jgi:hypothetical protein
MGTRIGFLGWYLHGFGTPSFFVLPPLYHDGNVIGHARVGTGEPQQRLRVDASFHRNLGPLLEGHGAVLGAGQARDGRADLAGSNSQQVMPGLHEIRKPRGRGFSLGAKSVITSRVKDGVRGTSRRCGGGFAKQVAGNVEKGEAPTLLRERRNPPR